MTLDNGGANEGMSLYRILSGLRNAAGILAGDSRRIKCVYLVMIRSLSSK